MAARSRQVRLECARNEATIGGLDAEDFPPAPTVKDGVSVALEPKGLRQAIAQTVFAAATDDSRPVLTGVDTKFEGDLLTLAASDGFRLSVYKLPLDEAGRRDDGDRRAGQARCRSCCRLLGDEEEPVTCAPTPARRRCCSG